MQITIIATVSIICATILLVHLSTLYAKIKCASYSKRALLNEIYKLRNNKNLSLEEIRNKLQDIWFNY